MTLRTFLNASFAAGAVAWILICAPPCAAHKSKANTTDTTQALNAYIARVRATASVAAGVDGSLWSPQARWANLAVDDKAHNVGDIVTILLNDSYSSTANNSIKTARTFSRIVRRHRRIRHSQPHERVAKSLQPQLVRGAQLVSGQSAITSSLNVTMAGQVMDVLPNGALIVQAARNMFVGNRAADDHRARHPAPRRHFADEHREPRRHSRISKWK